MRERSQHTREMAGKVMPLPARGGALVDARRPERTCRISWHPERGIFSVSIWEHESCLATFQLPQDRVTDLISAFVSPLAAASLAVDARTAQG